VAASRPGRFTPRKRAPYALDRRLVGNQSRSGHGVEEKKSQPTPGIKSRSSNRPARSQSLYRALPAHEIINVVNKNTDVLVRG
jgi:hypothetical protein